MDTTTNGATAKVRTRKPTRGKAETPAPKVGDREARDRSRLKLVSLIRRTLDDVEAMADDGDEAFDSHTRRAIERYANACEDTLTAVILIRDGNHLGSDTPLVAAYG
jgi:hypothetical protein